MKFARLYLKAFGVFRDRVIELPIRAGTDFHVIFGPNEAGKSTILRAVTSFLFGIPERTGDAFLHDYGALRVGATLVFADGTRLSAMRRKARKATLFAVDEATGAENTERPLPENNASDLVGGLDLPAYQSLFGLDLNGLVNGSEELLRGEGEVGRSLFQAAAGLANLRSLITGLEDEAAAIFKPRGSTGRLNRALKEYDEQKRVLRDATVRSYVWEAAEREYRQAQGKHEQARDALRNKRVELQRLERIRINLPLVAERSAKQAEADGLAGVPSLPAESAQLRAAAQERLRSAEEVQGAAEARLEQLKAELASVVVRESVLEHGSEIEQAFHAIAAYRSARDSLPQSARERADLLEKIRKLAADIGLACQSTQVSEFLPPETLTARVQSLIEEYLRLTDRDEQLDRQIRAKDAAVGGLNARMTILPEYARLDELETALGSVTNVADLEMRKRKLDGDIGDVDRRLEQETAALWSGTLSELLTLNVPLTDTASSFESEFTALAQEERLVADKEASVGHDLEERRRELKVLAATGEVVTQAEVAAARMERDSKWTDLRRDYIDKVAAPAETQAGNARPQGLAAELEAAIKEADRLADLLRADTERATNLEATRQRISDMQAEIERNNERRAALLKTRDDVQRRWNALIVTLRRSDLSPGGLREWLSRYERVAERHSALENLRAERTLTASDISRARERLDRALQGCGLAASNDEETAADALARAQQAVNAARKAEADRKSMSNQIQAATDDLRDLQVQRQQAGERLAGWRLQWKEVSERLRLPIDAVPAEARTRLDQFSRLSAALEDLAEREADAKAHQASVESFEAKVGETARKAGEPMEGMSLDVVAERLYEALAEARDARAKHQRLGSDMQRETRAISEAGTAAQQARNALDELVRRAACQRPDQLPEIEDKAARRQSLQQRLREIDEQLVRQNARPLAEVVQEAGDVTLDGMVGQIAEVTTAIDDLEGQVEEAQANVFSAKQRFDAIDGGPAAAETQQAMQSLAARIAQEARVYSRVRLASGVLARVIQLYRDQHQGPLLKRAGSVFARITLGSFSGLTVDYEDDRQVLLGVRPDGARVPVSGMSQGARDQLFLSLRLAAIEQHIAGRGPFPVIVDDVLVQFDDDRALATLEVLRELSDKSQVLLFTHHKHLVDIAKQSNLGNAVSVQSL